MCADNGGRDGGRVRPPPSPLQHVVRIKEEAPIAAPMATIGDCVLNNKHEVCAAPCLTTGGTRCGEGGGRHRRPPPPPPGHQRWPPTLARVRHEVSVGLERECVCVHVSGAAGVAGLSIFIPQTTTTLTPAPVVV